LISYVTIGHQTNINLEHPFNFIWGVTQSEPQ
jgi:hypothetical protein